jgi:hypothetical protein
MTGDDRQTQYSGCPRLTYSHQYSFIIGKKCGKVESWERVLLEISPELREIPKVIRDRLNTGL